MELPLEWRTEAITGWRNGQTARVSGLMAVLRWRLGSRGSTTRPAPV